jgi:predicted translin family RNA/ssDNA-binding protein
MAAFADYAAALAARHDRHERVVRLSRDATTASKRAVFALLAGGSSSGSTVDSPATGAGPLLAAARRALAAVAAELRDVPPLLHAGAYAPGAQEYVEAAVLQALEHGGDVPSCAALNAELAAAAAAAGGAAFVLTPADYILGLADVPGELVRRGIACLGVDDAALARACALVRALTAVLGAAPAAGPAPLERALARKMETMRQSQLKLEAAVYTARIRGAERPAALLRDALDDLGRAAPGDSAGGMAADA